jgi:hypothetical protein
MKRLSALLLIVAVLNPLCCCLTSAQTNQQANLNEEHACCPGDTDQNQSHSQTPSDCPHKMLSDKDAVISQDHSFQPASFVASVDHLIAVVDYIGLHTSQSALVPHLIEKTYIVPWIRSQTDCVRLL